MFDKIKIYNHPTWVIQPQEPPEWYSRFQKYFLSYPAPNIKEAAKRMPDNWSSLTEWREAAEAFHWEKRHKAYWRAMNRQNVDFVENRRAELQERIFKVAEMAITKAEEILNHPTKFVQVAKTDASGRPIIYNVHPNDKWSFKDATKMAQEASALMDYADNVTPDDKAIAALMSRGYEVGHPALKKIAPGKKKSLLPPAYRPGDERAAIDAMVEEAE